MALLLKSKGRMHLRWIKGLAVSLNCDRIFLGFLSKGS